MDEIFIIQLAERSKKEGDLLEQLSEEDRALVEEKLNCSEIPNDSKL